MASLFSIRIHTLLLFPDSPRSLEACRRLGIDIRELYYKPIDEFREKNVDSKIVEIRFQHYEHKRKELIYAAKKERSEII